MSAFRETADPDRVLSAGVSLLEAQRDAMIAGDADQLTKLNVRLAEWVASAPRCVAETGGRLATEPGAVAAVRVNLEINGALALRVATHAALGLEALFPATENTYGADGRARPPSVRPRALAA